MRESHQDVRIQLIETVIEEAKKSARRSGNGPALSPNSTRLAISEIDVGKTMDHHPSEVLLGRSDPLVAKLIKRLGIVDIGHNDVYVVLETRKPFGQALGIPFRTPDGGRVRMWREHHPHDGHPPFGWSRCPLWLLVRVLQRRKANPSPRVTGAARLPIIGLPWAFSRFAK
jgi:hypothetical protein